MRAREHLPAGDVGFWTRKKQIVKTDSIELVGVVLHSARLAYLKDQEAPKFLEQTGESPCLLYLVMQAMGVCNAFAAMLDDDDEDDIFAAFGVGDLDEGQSTVAAKSALATPASLSTSDVAPQAKADS